MFPECSVSQEKHNVSNSSAVKEIFVVMVVKFVLISQPIVTAFAPFPRVDAQRVGHFIHSVK